MPTKIMSNQYSCVPMHKEVGEKHQWTHTDGPTTTQFIGILRVSVEESIAPLELQCTG